MGEQYNFNDIIKNSFLELGEMTNTSIVSIGTGLLIALLVGLFIYFVYKKTFRGVVYSHNYNITLVIMTMVTTLVILTISTNIVLSLGMVGALSIVRFRTAVKDPIDIVFMFWAISAGIATGAGIYEISIFGSIIVGIVIYFLSFKKSKHSIYLLVVHYNNEADGYVKQQIRKMNYVIKSKVVRGYRTELTVEIRLKVDNTEFLHRIAELEGVQDVSLVQYSGDYAS